VPDTYIFCTTDPSLNPAVLLKMEAAIQSKELPNMEDDDGDVFELFGYDDEGVVPSSPFFSSPFFPCRTPLFPPPSPLGPSSY
jgi:hypothetical protein